MSEQAKVEPMINPEKAALNKNLERIAWGFFLIMLGGFMFLPKDQVPEGLWSIGVGVIMLGLNAARYFNQIRMSGFTTVLGIASCTHLIKSLSKTRQVLQGALKYKRLARTNVRPLQPFADVCPSG
jgi:hypothetical protein